MRIEDIKRLTYGDKRVVQIDLAESVVWRGLPRGYTELEYIETTGEQYIDTRFKPNQDTRVVCEFMFRGTSSDGSRDIYGARQGVNTKTYWLRVISNKWQPAYDTELGSTSIASDTTNWHVADQNKNVFYIDGVLGKEFAYGEFQSPAPLAIGGGYATYNGGTFYEGKSRYRAFRIYDDGVLVRSFIPCIDPNGNAGMYDAVNDEFYGNAGTGEFVTGPAWDGLPLGFKKLAYIETTGEEYIDTGFFLNQDSRIVCKFQLTSNSSGQCLYGARYRVVNRDFSTRIITSRWQANYGTEYGSVNQADFPSKYPADCEIHVIDHGASFFIDGEFIKTYAPTTFTTPLTCTIGSVNASNGMLYCNCRFYSFAIYDNGMLARDMIPCKTPDGRIGMYDTVGAKFYGNEGAGVLTAGEL